MQLEEYFLQVTGHDKDVVDGLLNISKTKPKKQSKKIYKTSRRFKPSEKTLKNFEMPPDNTKLSGGGLNDMFYEATSFNQPLNNWNVSKVKNMDHMFYEATSFNQPLNNWNVSKVKDMVFMFYNASSFNQPLNNWNVSNVTDMDSMFYEATSFNQPLHAPWYEEWTWEKI